MTLLTAGYWHTTYFPSRYWQEDYWLEYGAYVPPIPPLRGGAVVGRQPMPLSLIITPSGQVYLNVDLNKERKEEN